ncbi:hypothetical protein BGX27_006846 [Mortierella sp. AM989]|nr:hypothetical protein BGX27_006846 [Mortierella sp. AM989]
MNSFSSKRYAKDTAVGHLKPGLTLNDENKPPKAMNSLSSKRYAKDTTVGHLKPGLALNDENKPPQSTTLFLKHNQVSTKEKRTVLSVSPKCLVNKLLNEPDITRNGSPIRPTLSKASKQQQTSSRPKSDELGRPGVPLPLGVFLHNNTSITSDGVVDGPLLYTVATSSNVVEAKPDEECGLKRRTSVTMKVKHEIARHLVANPNETILNVATKFAVHRSVVNKVKSKLQEHLEWTEAQTSTEQKPCRFRGQPLPLRDILLAAWIKNQEHDRGTSLKDSEISHEAKEIQDTLYKLVLNPPKRNTFPSNWVKSFKEQRSALEGRSVHSEQLRGNSKELWALATILDQYNLSDIYSPFLAGDFTGVTPKGPLPLEVQQEARVVALISCNAEGADKDVILAQANRFEGIPTNHTSVCFSSRESLESFTFLNWLTRFNSTVNRNVLLILDWDTWNLLNIKNIPFPNLKFVTVVAIKNWTKEFLPEKSIPRNADIINLISGIKAKLSEIGDMNTPEKIVKLLHQPWPQATGTSVRQLFMDYLAFAGRSQGLQLQMGSLSIAVGTGPIHLEFLQQ